MGARCAAAGSAAITGSTDATLSWQNLGSTGILGLCYIGETGRCDRRRLYFVAAQPRTQAKVWGRDVVVCGLLDMV